MSDRQTFVNLASLNRLESKELTDPTGVDLNEVDATLNIYHIKE